MVENELEKELEKVTDQSELAPSGQNLLAEKDQITYEKAEEIAGQKAHDALLLGCEMGLINSVRRSKCVEWGGA